MKSKLQVICFFFYLSNFNLMSQSDCFYTLEDFSIHAEKLYNSSELLKEFYNDTLNEVSIILYDLEQDSGSKLKYIGFNKVDKRITEKIITNYKKGIKSKKVSVRKRNFILSKINDLKALEGETVFYYRQICNYSHAYKIIIIKVNNKVVSKVLYSNEEKIDIFYKKQQPLRMALLLIKELW